MNIKHLEFTAATNSMLDEINNLYINCREHLLRNGIYQWDERYPNKDYFLDCMESQCLYVLVNNTEILGHVVLNEWESEEWDRISWKGDNPLIIHSLMVNPLIQGKGLGTEFVILCEQFAKRNGYRSIRLDAFSGNKIAIHIYERNGYQKRGSVIFTSKPEGCQEYLCFEKVL